MFAPGDSRPQTSLSELERTERRIVYGWHRWSFVLIVGVVAGLSAPFWLVFPPQSPSGSPERFRWIALALWGGLALVGRALPECFGPRLILDLPGKSVSKRLRVWGRTRVEWEYPADQVSAVTVGLGSRGVVYVQVTLKQGGILAVEQGIQEGFVRRLGADLARCWQVPLRGLGGDS